MQSTYSICIQVQEQKTSIIQLHVLLTLKALIVCADTVDHRNRRQAAGLFKVSYTVQCEVYKVREL